MRWPVRRRESLAKVKKLARCLWRHPRGVTELRDDKGQDNIIKVFSDSDWAGCLKTRKSTSGGVMTVDGGLVNGLAV